MSERPQRNFEKISPGSRVGYVRINPNNPMDESDRNEVQLAEDDTEVKAGETALGSPLGKALIEAEIGDMIVVNDPEGSYTVEVQSIR